MFSHLFIYYCPTFRIHFVTYNVGTASPDGDFRPLLGLVDAKDLFDIYVISLQEVSAQPQNLLMDALYEDPWTRKLMDVLAGRYIKIKTIRMQGLVLSVFVKEKHLLNIRDMDTGYKRTGFSGMWVGLSLFFIIAYYQSNALLKYKLIFVGK